MTTPSNANTSGLPPTDALRLVPVEPTEAMLREGAAAVRDFYSAKGPYARTRAMWSAMLAAAPASPLPGGVDRNALIDVIAEAAGWGVSSGYIKAERTADAVIALLGLPAAPTGEPK